MFVLNDYVSGFATMLFVCVEKFGCQITNLVIFDTATLNKKTLFAKIIHLRLDITSLSELNVTEFLNESQNRSCNKMGTSNLS